MKKIEELVKALNQDSDYADRQVYKIMKEYAEWYAKKHCENLFEKIGHWSKCTVKELSNLILETELPEHE